jgi:hypothetical protein
VSLFRIFNKSIKVRLSGCTPDRARSRALPRAAFRPGGPRPAGGSPSPCCKVAGIHAVATLINQESLPPASTGCVSSARIWPPSGRAELIRHDPTKNRLDLVGVMLLWYSQHPLHPYQRDYRQQAGYCYWNFSHCSSCSHCRLHARRTSICPVRRANPKTSQSAKVV